MSDYLEAELYIDEIDDTETVSVYATYKDRSMHLFKGVTSNPVRMHGVWIIVHKFLGVPAMSCIPAETVAYWTVITEPDDE